MRCKQPRFVVWGRFGSPSCGTHCAQRSTTNHLTIDTFSAMGQRWQSCFRYVNFKDVPRSHLREGAPRRAVGWRTESWLDQNTVCVALLSDEWWCYGLMIFAFAAGPEHLVFFRRSSWLHSTPDIPALLNGIIEYLRWGISMFSKLKKRLCCEGSACRICRSQQSSIDSSAGIWNDASLPIAGLQMLQF